MHAIHDTRTDLAVCLLIYEETIFEQSTSYVHLSNFYSLSNSCFAQNELTTHVWPMYVHVDVTKSQSPACVFGMTKLRETDSLSLLSRCKDHEEFTTLACPSSRSSSSVSEDQSV
jgi:hypothetical protein